MDAMTGDLAGSESDNHDQDHARSRSIGDYGLLADCNGAALINLAGSIDWLCLPRYDSPAMFARLLDPDGGHWSIAPVGDHRVERRYLPGTLVLETTFITAIGRVRLIDALAFAHGQRVHDLGLDSPHEVLRLIEGIAGTVDLRMELAPRPEYGLIRPLFRQTDGGGETQLGPNRIAIRAGVPTTIEDATMRATFRVGVGQRVGFALRWAAVDAAPPQVCPEDQVSVRMADTIAAWRSWETKHDIYQGAHRDLVRLGSRILKGLSYRPTGAIVAAPTTSLPETIGGERNWDYRYAWIRDASLTLEALYIGACSDEADRFIAFVTSAAGGRVRNDHHLQIMFGVGGEHDLTERTLPHLRGWRDSRPVRIGNGAWEQSQLDVYGELLNALHLYREKLGDFDPEMQRFIADLASAAAQHWRDADAGMWEMRGPLQHHLSSKVFCWVALDRAVALAPGLGVHGRAEEWVAERDRIRAEILTRGWSEKRQAYAQAFDSDELDAAALLMPIVGFLPASDPRMRSTIEAIARDLTDGGFVLRYQNQSGLNPDGLSEQEGTFVICSCWLVSCLAMAEELERAEKLFARITGYANDLGLLAEEIDARTGDLLGNFPQAFSHIGVITAAWQIDQARERAQPHILSNNPR